MFWVLFRCGYCGVKVILSFSLDLGCGMIKIDSGVYSLDQVLPPDFQGWNGDSPVFGRLIGEVLPSVIIEVGSWKGQSAINMGGVVKALGLSCKIFCVDTWLGALEFWVGDLAGNRERDLGLKFGYPSVYYQFLSNVIHAGLQDVIVPFPNTSLIGARYFKSEGVVADLVYIDASHDFEDVLMDLYAYHPLVRSGGVMFGDDYTSAWPGVVRAVDEYARVKGLVLEVLDGNFWVIRIP